MANGKELDGRVAIVTGAARNIGRAIAVDLAAAGAAVVVNARTSDAEAQAVAREIEAAGGRALAVIADVTDEAAVGSMAAAAVARFGRIDILVNNAAVRREQAFAEMSLGAWREILTIILDGAFICAKACLPQLAASGAGAIVNIGGLTGHRGATGRAHVIAAKAGLAGLTKALALDLAPKAITVNCVVPGTIESQRGLPGVPERPEGRRTPPPIGRRGEPEEIAAMVRMLCGPDARYITGQAIHVNGGGYMP